MNVKAIQEECEVPETVKLELLAHFQHITFVTYQLSRIILAILTCISKRSYMNSKSQDWIEIIGEGKKIIQENERRKSVLKCLNKRHS